MYLYHFLKNYTDYQEKAELKCNTYNYIIHNMKINLAYIHVYNHVIE